MPVYQQKPRVSFDPVTRKKEDLDHTQFPIDTNDTDESYDSHEDEERPRIGAETILSGPKGDEYDVHSETTLRSKDISSKVDYYMDTLKDLSKKIGDMKRRAVIRYAFLNKINFATHTSIIVSSSFSAYIQTIVPESEREDWLRMVILGITSYSGLILALMKFYKLEEKKENAHNLRDRLADLEGKTCHIIDTIKPWKYKEHYCEQHNGTKGKDKVTEWTALIEKVDGEYMTIIEQKKELFSNYDKLFDSLKAVQVVEETLARSQSFREKIKFLYGHKKTEGHSDDNSEDNP